MKAFCSALLLGCGAAAPSETATSAKPAQQPEPVCCEMQTIVSSGLNFVTEYRTFCDARGFRVRSVQRRDGKVYSTHEVVRDRDGRPVEISGTEHTSLRYGEHGELLRRNDQLFVWKGRFFGVPGAIDPRGEAWSDSEMPSDLATQSRVGFTGEVTETSGPSSIVRTYVYDEHARLVRSLEDHVETLYTWNDRGQLMLTVSGDESTVYRYDGDELAETITSRHGVEFIGVRYKDGHAIEGRQYGRVIEHSTWSTPCAK